MIIRLPKDRNYTSLSRNLLQNNELSFEARGVMGYLLSHPADWTPRANDIELAGKIGRDQRRRILAELERAGYLTYHRVQDKKGQWGWEITAHEEPAPEDQRTQELGKKRRDSEPEDGSSEESSNRGAENPPIGNSDRRETDPSLINSEVQNSKLINSELINLPASASPSQAGDEKPSLPAKSKTKTGVSKETQTRLYDIFTNVRANAYETPYQSQRGDFVQLSKLWQLCEKNNWELSDERFGRAAENYFASDLSVHTLADLCVRFSTFYQHVLDRFNKPVEGKNGNRRQTTAEIYAGYGEMFNRYRTAIENESALQSPASDVRVLGS